MPAPRDCTPGGLHLYLCVCCDEGNLGAADIWDEDDEDVCPECGAYLESEYHEWDCSYGDDELWDDDDEDVDMEGADDE